MADSRRKAARQPEVIRGFAIAYAQVAQILAAIERGEPQAAGKLLPLVYDELRRLAARKLARETPGQTLQATALVHEAWLRLGGDQQPDWTNRAHFFAAAAEAMRRILIENARRKRAQRHGGQFERVNLDGLELAAAMDDGQLLTLHEALDRLAAVNADAAEFVKLRFFAGLTMEQAAEVLGLSKATAKRRWTHARAWLYREIQREFQTENDGRSSGVWVGKTVGKDSDGD